MSTDDTTTVLGRKQKRAPGRPPSGSSDIMNVQNSVDSSHPDQGWRIVELSQVGKIVTGSTPPKARQEYYGGSFHIRFLRYEVYQRSHPPLDDIG